MIITSNEKCVLLYILNQVRNNLHWDKNEAVWKEDYENWICALNPDDKNSLHSIINEIEKL